MNFEWIKHSFLYAWSDLFARGNRISTAIMWSQVFFLALVTFVLLTVNKGFSKQLGGVLKDPASYPVIVSTDGFTATDVSLEQMDQLKSLRKTSIKGKGVCFYPENEILKNGWQVGAPAHQGAFGESTFTCELGGALDGMVSLKILDTDSLSMVRDFPKELIAALNAESVLISQEVIAQGDLPANTSVGSTLACANLPVVQVGGVYDKQKLDNFQAIISMKFFNRIRGLNGFSRVLVFPKDIEDIPLIEEAVKRLNLQTDS